MSILLAGIAKERQPAAGEILSQLIALAEFAENVRNNVASKLQDVSWPPSPQVNETKSIQTEMPLFFESLRERIQKIDNALAGIEDVLSRTEL